MKKKLFKALKNKYKSLGFGDEAFNGVAAFLAVTITEESGIETAIGGVEPLLQSLQKDADRRVGSLQSQLDKLKEGKGAGADDDDDDEDGNEPAPAKKKAVNSGNPEIAQLTNLVKNLTTAVSGLVEKDKNQSLQQKWHAAAKEKGVKNQKLIDKWMPKDEADLDDALEDLVEFNTQYAKEEANEQSTGRPSGGGGGKAGSKELTKKGESLLDSWAKKNEPVTTNQSESK